MNTKPDPKLANNCCFCEKSLVNKETGWNGGHNPEPYYWDNNPYARCCDKCNHLVVYTRLEQRKEGCYKRLNWTNLTLKLLDLKI